MVAGFSAWLPPDGGLIGIFIIASDPVGGLAPWNIVRVASTISRPPAPCRSNGPTQTSWACLRAARRHRFAGTR